VNVRLAREPAPLTGGTVPFDEGDLVGQQVPRTLRPVTHKPALVLRADQFALRSGGLSAAYVNLAAGSVGSIDRMP
jgi:hypothetical protein